MANTENMGNFSKEMKKQQAWPWDGQFLPMLMPQPPTSPMQ
jgi:hypothetical protein